MAGSESILGVKKPIPDPARGDIAAMSSASVGPKFHSIRVGDTMFTVLRRYTDLASIGSGAQGVVW